MTTTHTPLPEGTVIKVTKLPEDLPADDDRIPHGRVGQEYKVEGYYPANDPDAEPGELPYYLLDTEHSMGGCFWADPDCIELVRTRDEQARMESLPDPKDIAKLIQDGLMSGHYYDELGELEITETTLYTEAPTEDWPEGQHGFKFGVEFVGRRRGGGHFAGTVRLTSYYHADF